MSFRNETHEYDAELWKHIWSLKDQNKDFDIKWSIFKKSSGYSVVSKSCTLGKASNMQFQREREVTQQAIRSCVEVQA